MKHTVLVFLVLIAGCASHRTVPQAVADLNAAAIAYQQAPTPDIQRTIAELMAFDLIALSKSFPDLPKPTHSPEEIVKAPELFAAVVKQDQKEAPAVVVPRGTNPDPTPGIFLKFGELVLHVGLIGVTLATLAWAASKMVAFLAGFSELIEEAFILSSIACLVGVALIWTGRNTWILYAAIGAFGALRAYDVRALWWPTVRGFFTKKTAGG